MKKLFALIAGLVLIAGCESAIGKSTMEATIDTEGYKVISKKEITFKWKIIEEQLESIVSAPEQGWVAVGFNPEKPKMDKSNFIIGYVKDNEVVIEDHIAKGWRHSADKEQNIIKSSGEEKDGTTTLRFTIPLVNDANQQDVALAADQEVYVLLAYNSKDDLKSRHKKKTVVKINL